MGYKLRVTLILAACAIAAVLIAVYFIPYQLRHVKSPFQPTAKSIAREARKSLPKKISEGAEMYDARADGDTVAFKIRLNLDSTEFDVEEWRREWQASVLKSTCQNHLIKFSYFMFGISVRYTVFAKDDYRVAETQVSEHDCK